MESGSLIFNNSNGNSSDSDRRRGGKRHRKRGGRGQRTRTQKLDLFSLCGSADTSVNNTRHGDSGSGRDRGRGRGGRDDGITQRHCHSAPAATTPSSSRRCNSRSDVITTTRADSILVRHPTDDPTHHELATALEHGAHRDTICSICRMGIPLTGMATAHGCNHLFCYTCIAKWVGSYRSTCPVCTSQITLLHRWVATPTEDANEDSLDADTESSSSLDDCSDREEKEEEVKRTPAVTAAEVVIDITSKNGDVTSLRLTIQTEKIEKREMSNHSRDLSCLDHAFFSQEIDQVLSEAIRVHRGMRSAYCTMQSNYKFNTRFKRESQKAWDNVQQIKNNLAAMKEEMIRQAPFDPEFCMQQLYHMQQQLSEIEAASNPYMAVYVGGWGPLDHNLSYSGEAGDYDDDDDDDCYEW